MQNAYTPWAEFVQKTAGEVPDEVVEMVRAGKRLQAMKRYMDLCRAVAIPTPAS